MKKKVLAILAVGLLGGPIAAHAVTLVTDADGILTGARGVSVLGSLYDVDFRVGSCSTYYGNCGPGGNFGDMYEYPDPQKTQFAANASWALLDQVLVGDYDLDAGRTFGCTRTVAVTYGRCYVLTPYWWQNINIGTSSGMVYMVAVNGSVLPDTIWDPRVYSNDDMVLSSDNMGNRHPNPLTDGMADPSSAWSVWAVWSPASVPEPGTLALLWLGLTGLVLSRKRKAD